MDNLRRTPAACGKDRWSFRSPKRGENRPAWRERRWLERGSTPSTRARSSGRSRRPRSSPARRGFGDRWSHWRASWSGEAARWKAPRTSSARHATRSLRRCSCRSAKMSAGRWLGPRPTRRSSHDSSGRSPGSGPTTPRGRASWSSPTAGSCVPSSGTASGPACCPSPSGRRTLRSHASNGEPTRNPGCWRWPPRGTSPHPRASLPRSEGCRPVTAGVAGYEAEGLACGPDAARVGAAVVPADLVLDLIVGREARGVDLDLGVVDKEVVARGPHEEPVALLRVEPLDTSPLECRARGVVRPTVDGGGGVRGPVPVVGGRGGLPAVGLEHYGVLGDLDGHRLDARPVFFPDGVFGDGRVEPQPPAVAFSVVEYALEDALGLAGARLAAVDVVAGAERLH